MAGVLAGADARPAARESLVVSKPVFVIGDVHGAPNLVRGLLLKAGLLENHGKLGLLRTPSVKVVQVGDLCNCVGSSRDGDIECLAKARRWFDVYLVGNHEHPYFGGPAFSGFFPFPEIKERLLRLERDGFLRPTFRVGNVLVSHAGVGPGFGFPSAASAQARIVAAWRADEASYPFSAIGAARGGWQSTGGVLWADASEPKEAKFTQIVGHTPQPKIRRDSYGDHSTWFIDLGGGKDSSRLGGIWIREGRVEEPVVFDSEEDGDLLDLHSAAA